MNTPDGMKSTPPIEIITANVCQFSIQSYFLANFFTDYAVTFDFYLMRLKSQKFHVHLQKNH
jgi:hypothetical protein